MKEALLYDKLENKKVRCRLCNHYCLISEDGFGICGVRKNIKGSLYSLVWGLPVALNIDPIEKKPLFHFLPGSKSFSIATIGCNLRCKFCQNWQLSQARFQEGAFLREEDLILPEKIVEEALRCGCKSISYTYTEPTVFFEYALDIAREAKKEGLFNNFVTNGYMSKECLSLIQPYLDAANVDLKFFRESSYQNICGAKLTPVLESIRLMKNMGIWIEITTLLIPGENDSDQELTDIAQFIADIDNNTPWHISRFHPDYEFGDCEPTPIQTLKRAEQIGKKAGLRFVYVGNVSQYQADTFCLKCNSLLIRREGFSVLEYRIRDSRCIFCGTRIPGIF